MSSWSGFWVGRVPCLILIDIDEQLVCVFYAHRVCLLCSVWMEEWKSENMVNCGRMEKWKDEKYLIFPLMCLVGGMEKWEGEKLFYLVRKKNRMIENVIYVN